jgi:hypothetical protein
MNALRKAQIRQAIEEADRTGISLKTWQYHQIIRELLRGPTPPINVSQLKQECARLLKGGYKIAAIKLFREKTNWNLRESKIAVEELATKTTPSWDTLQRQASGRSKPRLRHRPAPKSKPKKKSKV